MPNSIKTKVDFWASCLLLSGIGVATISFLAGRAELLELPLFWLLSIPLFCLLSASWFLGNEVRKSATSWLWLVLLGIWLVHFIGVLVPETGFDAVWYHLPVIDQFLTMGKITYLPELYQSANPLLTDMLFLLGFQAAGELGAKLVAFGIGVSLVLVCYVLAKPFLTQERWLAWFLISVSLIQPVTWQASSVYVDVGMAVWLLGSLHFLLNYFRTKKSVYFLGLSGLLLGAALATKAFIILLLPVFILLVWLALAKEPLAEKIKKEGLFLLGVVAVAAPFYMYITQAVGTPWYSLTTHVSKLDEIGGSASLLTYLVQRVTTLPSSLWYLTVQARDYVSILICLFLPIFIWQFKVVPRNLIIFSLASWLLWWLVPPTSTRYAIAGFVTLLLVLFVVVQQSVIRQPKNKNWERALLAVVMVASMWSLLPRLVVARRNLSYLASGRDKEAYLSQFYDGNIDQHLQKWSRRGRDH